MPSTSDPDHQAAGQLHPPLEPLSHGTMDTGAGHHIYFEQCGNPRGLSVVVLHGGPASGCSPMQRRFFDPAVFRIVLFDQRGCGRSTPLGALANNDTAALVRDIEQLRRQLGIDRWIVFGGSWGASLAIAYAAAHLSACLGVILRGTFLTGNRDLDWFFGGAASLLPVPWQKLVAALALPLTLDQCEYAGHAVLASLQRRLFADDPAVCGAAAAAWAEWEDAVSRPGTGRPARRPAEEAGAERPAGAAAGQHPDLVAKYRVQAHYLAQRCFMGEELLLGLARRLESVPVEIVHGRLDWVCRPTNAWQLHQAIGASNLTWVDHAGHNPYEPNMLKALADAIRRLQDHACG